MSNVSTGEGCEISDAAEVGVGDPSERTVLGDEATVRSGSVLYSDVRIGDRFVTGHDVLIREATDIGDDVLVGTKTVIDGDVTIGSRVSLQTRTYVPKRAQIGDDVFFGPSAVITNDPYPIRSDSRLEQTVVCDHVSVGANATILPGVTIGEGSFVAAGAIVTEDVPPDTLAVGTPANHRPLPAKLAEGNQIA